MGTGLIAGKGWKVPSGHDCRTKDVVALILPPGHAVSMTVTGRDGVPVDIEFRNDEDWERKITWGHIAFAAEQTDRQNGHLRT